MLGFEISQWTQDKRPFITLGSAVSKKGPELCLGRAAACAHLRRPAQRENARKGGGGGVLSESVAQEVKSLPSGPGPTVRSVLTREIRTWELVNSPEENSGSLRHRRTTTAAGNASSLVFLSCHFYVCFLFSFLSHCSFRSLYAFVCRVLCSAMSLG